MSAQFTHIDPEETIRKLKAKIARLVEKAQPAHVPASWMEMVTANLVREGVNKHKARELAEHFYSLAQPAPYMAVSNDRMSVDPHTGNVSIGTVVQRTWVDLTDDEIDYIMAFVSPHCDEIDFARAIEAKLKEKNT